MIEEIKRISEWNVKASEGNKQFADEQKAQIKKVYAKYFTITTNQFSGTCNNCYVDAWILIKQLNKNQKKLIDMTNCKFKLPKEKEGEMPTLIQMQGLGGVYSNHNMTDEIALKILAKNKKMISAFEIYPSNWETMLAEYKQRTENGEKKEIPAEKPQDVKSVEKTKEEKIKLFKENVDSLSKKELQAMAEENNLIKKEWDKLNVDQLINYLAENLHEKAVHAE